MPGNTWVLSAAEGMLGREILPEMVDVSCWLLGRATVVGLWEELTVVRRDACEGGR
jgi:hypothetical protein